jgi:hypothetical protein
LVAVVGKDEVAAARLNLTQNCQFQSANMPVGFAFVSPYSVPLVVGDQKIGYAFPSLLFQARGSLFASGHLHPSGLKQWHGNN